MRKIRNVALVLFAVVASVAAAPFTTGESISEGSKAVFAGVAD